MSSREYSSRGLHAVLAVVLAGCGGATAPSDPTQSPPPDPAANDSPSADPGASDPASDTPVPSDPTVAPPDSDPEALAPACVRTISVAASGPLNAAIKAAKGGDCIVLANGDYTLDPISAKGTAAAPIVIRAEHVGKATVATSALLLSGAAYVTVQGLLYTSSEGARLVNCDHCRVTRFTFHIKETGPVSWLTVSGSRGGDNRIDHNELGPKTHEGNLIGLYGSGSTILPRTRIDHNFFHDVGPVTSNGWETIRGGLSGLSHSSGFITIEHNLFKSCQGDPEIISTKSNDNVVRYNTLRTSKGQITLRIGSRTSVYGNYILGGGVADTGGIRVHGQDHKVWNNYIEGVDGSGINLEGGESEETPDPGTAHYRVYRAQVVNNTIIGAGSGIQIGGAHPLSPVDTVVANNLIQGTSGAMIREALKPVNTKYAGNIVNPSGSATVGITVPATQVRRVNPLLTRVGEVLQLTAQSPAIDAATGAFAFLNDDIEGHPRTKADVGAIEYTTAAGTRLPLTEADVGPGAP